MERRHFEERFFQALMLIATLIVVGSLLAIMAEVLLKGASGLTFSMLTQTPRDLGRAGGILNAILGSIYLAVGATVLAFLLSFPVVLYLRAYAPAWLAGAARTCLDILWGVPSIVYGAFGFMTMVYFGLKISLLAGMITVALFELPIMARAMDEVVQMVPRELEEAAYALASTRWETLLNVTTRQALPGLATGVLLAFGRGMGDAASVLLTAGYTDKLPESLFRQVATLPLAIFSQSQTPFPEVQQRAYTSALVLTLIILATSLLARLIARRFQKYVIR